MGLGRGLSGATKRGSGFVIDAHVLSRGRILVRASWRGGSGGLI